MVERRTSEMRHQHWPIAVSIAIGVAGAVWSKAQSPLFVWNVSRSVPVGLYVIVARPPSKGEFAALRLSEPMRGLARARGYLPTHAMLIKPVAALAPDLVCRHGAIVTINGRLVARALTADTSSRSLPQWGGCHEIDGHQFFVLSGELNSFDSRYFGAVDAFQVIGTGISIYSTEFWPSSESAKN